MNRVADSVHVLEVEVDDAPVEVEGVEGSFWFYPTVVETDDGVVLFDVGFSQAVDQIESGLESAGFGLEDIELLLLTHHDADHAWSLAEVTERTDALVAAHTEEAPYLDGRKPFLKIGSEEFPLKLADDQAPYEPVPVDLELVGGEVIRTAAGPMELIHVPGHTPGMLAAYLPDVKTLIAADAMISRDGLAGPERHFTPDMDAAIDSVGALSDLDVEHVICYHGGPIEATTEDVAAVYDSLQS